MVGYSADVLNVRIIDPYLPAPGRLLRSLFIDGWFPLFPWLGFAFAGAGAFASFASTGASLRRIRVLFAGIGLVGMGAALLAIEIPGVPSRAAGSVLESRAGYSEIFYPATPGFFVLAVGVFIVLAWLLAHIGDGSAAAPFSFFGRYALMVYIVHQVLAVHLVRRVMRTVGWREIEHWPLFILANLIVIALVAALGLALDRLPAPRAPRPLLLRMLLGR